MVDADSDEPFLHGLPGSMLRTQLRQIPGRTVALLDTCYAGAFIQGQQTRYVPLDISKFVAELSGPETGVAVYSATTNRPARGGTRYPPQRRFHRRPAGCAE
jgi:hypothetical protein